MKLFVLICAVVLTVATAWWWAAQPSDVTHARSSSDATASSSKKSKAAQVRNDAISTDPQTTAKHDSGAVPVNGAPSPSIPGKPPTRADVIAKARAALEITQPTERLAAFQKLLAQTADPAGLNGIVEAFQVFLRAGRRFDREWQAFWHGLASRDVQAALSVITSHGPDTSWNATALNMTLNEWGGRDPAAAIQWLAAHESEMGDQSFDDATLGLIAGYADRDLAGATGYALSVVKPDDPLGNRVTSELAQRALQQRGTDGMAAWFDGLGNDDQKKRLFRAVADRLGSVDFNKKVAWLTSQSRNLFRDENSYRDAANQMAKSDPRSAMDFVVQVARSPKDGGFPGIGAASFEWLLQDPGDFTQWFRTLPAGDVRTNVLRALDNSLQNDAKLDSDKRQRALEFLQVVPR